jgi:WhiB family transcriptional regulator, redox-sensing transcriptional regulator
MLHIAAIIDADLEGAQAWRLDAACRGQDPELFFPKRGASRDGPLAFCRRCPVREPCLGGDNVIAGIWGGFSTRARRDARRRRYTAAEAIAHLDGDG